jgi:hypothetical protein
VPFITAVRPVRRYYLGLEADPYDALSTVAWEEVLKVPSSTLSWGAQHELQRVEPSRCSVTFDNRDARFEPANTGSPYYPNLRPLNRLRIVDTWDGVDYIRFTGYVVDWPRSWTGPNRATVTVEAFDSLGAVLNAVNLPAWPWEFQVRSIIEKVPSTGKAVWLRLNETSGTVAADSSGYNLDGQYQGTPTLGVAGLTADGDKGFSPRRTGDGERASLPYKDLITGYPFSIHCLFKTGLDRSAQKAILYASAGPTPPVRQQFAVYIDATSGLQPGKILLSLWSASGNDRRVYSSGTVDNSVEHRLAVVATSASDIKLYVDGVDVTVVDLAGSPPFPNDLVTGYGIGNTPAVVFGDFSFGTADGDVLDEMLILDGYALTTTDIGRLSFTAAATPGLLSKSGLRLDNALTLIGWPSADRDIDDGLTTVQQGFVAGKFLAYAQRLDVTEGGRFFQAADGVLTFHDRHRILQPPYTVSQATFGDGAGEIGYQAPFNHGEDDLDIHNDIQRGNVGGKVQVRRDKASKDRYGWKTHAITDMLGTSDEEARDRATRDLALYKDPVTRIRSITIRPQEDAAAGTTVWEKVLAFGQNTRVTVKAQPPGSPLITQQSHIESCQETVTAKDWTMTLGLSAAQSVEFWILGTSELGTGTRLSY